MASPKNILIAGAGIAGPTLALLLSRCGHKCTIVERSPTLRASGQQIDASGPALDVLKHMDVYDAILERRVEDDGLNFVDVNDNIIVGFAAGTKGGLVKEVEIMRGDLVDIIFQATKNKVEYTLGDYITAIEHVNGKVKVKFAKEKKEKQYDLVVAADGLRSRTRDLAFPTANTVIDSKGMYASYLSLPWQESDGTWSRWFNSPSGRCSSIRPNKKNGTSSAYLTQCTYPAAVESIVKLPPEEQKQHILSTFSDVPWETPRILREIENPYSDFYLQEAAQSHSCTLSSAHVVLLGDAGYCPSPVSGQGTSLALVGAYILAGCIATHDDIDEALQKYEELVRPHVKKAQDLPPGVPWIVNPQSRAGIGVLNSVLWAVGLGMRIGVGTVLGKVGEYMPAFGGKELDLPDFPALAANS